MTDWQDILERAGWTAAQAFVGSLTTAQLVAAITEADLAGLQALGLAGIGAAVASLASFVKTLAQERLGVIETRQYLP